MREMHKWKDKVEFSLDNRQIFFLFFGLSVIGCFIFALGIMTGRRLHWVPGQETAALAEAEGEDSLALLDGEEEPEQFAFKAGLAASDAETIPPTRDPSLPPRDEDVVKAEKAAEQVAAAEAVEKQAAVEQKQAEVDAVEATIGEQDASLAQATPEAASAPSAEPGKRQFTLQMKAFSRREDADKLADKLRHNGHDVRIETHEVRGRSWHRVRLGEFDTWDEALAAKQEFEQTEHVIAYVVSL